MSDSSSVASPFEPSTKLHADHRPFLSNPTVYRHLVGKLNYLTHTRPDLSFAILKISKFMQSPWLSYYTAAINVLRYLQTDPGQGILFNSAPFLKLFSFCDEDWASYLETRRSMSGFYISFGGSHASWKSNKISFSFSIISRSGVQIHETYCCRANLNHQVLWRSFYFTIIAGSCTFWQQINDSHRKKLHLSRADETRWVGLPFCPPTVHFRPHHTLLYSLCFTACRYLYQIPLWSFSPLHS